MTGLVTIGMMVSGAGGRYRFQVGHTITLRTPTPRPYAPQARATGGTWVFLWCALGEISGLVRNHIQAHIQKGLMGGLQIQTARKFILLAI